MKVVKKNYPFTIIVEDKISNGGKMYRSVSLAYTYLKDKDAKEYKDRYDTKWLNLGFDEKELLKLGNLCNNCYSETLDEKEKEKAEKKAILNHQYNDLDYGIE